MQDRPVAPDLVILKESRSELVVFKPAGMATELREDRLGVSLKERVARRTPGVAPKLPHRLDTVSRGLVLVCLTPEAIAFHNAEIQARRWEKYYLARVAAPGDRPPADLLGLHKAFLKEVGGRARLVHAGGKPSRLEILAAAPVPGRADRWHLVIRLLTGRFHQIRVMAAALGLPLAGDPLYDPLARDPADFYLEHVILKYTDFDTRSPATAFLRDYPERGPLAPAIAALLADLAGRP
ncbi:MAG TPA: pseudouridine synthase [Polyangia bacterium]